VPPNLDARIAVAERQLETIEEEILGLRKRIHDRAQRFSRCDVTEMEVEQLQKTNDALRVAVEGLRIRIDAEAERARTSMEVHRVQANQTATDLREKLDTVRAKQGRTAVTLRIVVGILAAIGVAVLAVIGALLTR
jgi:chromosome segregation ATPase